MFAILRVPKNLCAAGAFLAFATALFGQSTNYTISLAVLPANAGTVGGYGTFAAGSTNTVTAMTNAGYAFVDWTSNGAVLSSSPSYTFTLEEDVTLVAHFAPALTVTVSAAPAWDGTASGGGTYASNSTVTVTAQNNNGYAFTNWTLEGAVAGTNAAYSFTVTNNVDLVANFVTNPLVPQGAEFSVLGSRPGDQVWPSLSLSASGGCIAWQDNWIDRKGGGLGASLLGAGFEAGQPVRVNKVVTGMQRQPQVQLLANDNIIFVWQGSVTASGRPYIYARFAKNAAPKAGYYTGDIQVNTYTADQQVNPAVAGLADGSAIITWASYGQNGGGSMWGVYARRLTAAGKAPKADNDGSKKQFLVSQYTSFNQRNPAVAALAGGNYVIAWVSEQERAQNSVDIYARIFTSAGVPVTDEIAVNSGTNVNVCDTPAVAPLNDGGFTVVWAQKDVLVATNGWDIWGRAFSASGSPEVSDFRINTHLYGDQYAPKIAASPSGSLVVWTSLGQDGSREGVFGRFLAGGTQLAGSEFQVNTTWISQQMHPAVAWNGVDHFLVVWTSFVGASGFDLYGQAYILNSSP
jgi:hypothetical protein